MSKNFFTTAILLFLLIPSVGLGQTETVKDKPTIEAKSDEGAKLIKAAQTGDMDLLKAALEAGADVNSKTAYGATALFFACDRGNQDIVKVLLAKGADPNVKDTFYNATPITWAQQKGEQEIILMLYAAGGNGAMEALIDAAGKGDVDKAKQLIENKCVDQDGLIKVRKIVSLGANSKKTELLALLNSAGLPAMKEIAALTKEQASRYVGKFTSTRFGLEVTEKEGQLEMKIGNGFASPLKLLARQDGVDEFFHSRSVVRFKMQEDKVESITVSMGGNEFVLLPEALAKKTAETPDKKVAETKPASPDAGENAEAADVAAAKFVSSDMEVSSVNWPGFRGVGSRGIADGQNAPAEWTIDEDEAENKNVKWKTPVAGLGMSCPSVWGDRVFVTSAVAEGEEQNVKIGLYGDVASVEDDREYQFKVVCLSKSSGSVLWERVANQAKPMVKRHAKSSHANPTVATNGQHVVAFFGSEGLYCYDVNGDLKWKRDLGFLDSGWFYDPGYQWGFGSSPIIYKDRVIVQCDIQGQSFIAALQLSDGKEIWRTEREEIPTWSSPTVHEFDGMTMVITNGTKAARGYDMKDGSELWSLSGHSEIVVPTPSVAHGLIFLSSGYSPIQPIYAIKPSAHGDVSLDSGETKNESIEWSVKRGGPYMPTPIVYGDYLYCCANSGILSCYEAKTGKQVYRKRMKAPGGALSFTASPIAADGNLFCTAEDGRVLVVKAGPKFKLVRTNTLGESVLATPAVSEGMMIFRGQNHVIAVGK